MQAQVPFRWMSLAAVVAVGIYVAGARAMMLAQAALSTTDAVELPRVEGRIDHLAFDPAHGRLFVAALGNNTVEVIDAERGVHLRSLPNFEEPQGIAAVPDVNAVAVATGESGSLQILDAGDYHVIRTVHVGDDADNVRYDAETKRLYVGYGRGALAAVDVAEGRIIATVRLAGHPESFQLERSGSRIFVNVPDARQIAVVDRRTHTLVGTWMVSGAQANYPMALDESTQRLFIGCRIPAKILVYDTSSGRLLGGIDTVGDTDDLFYDGVRRRLYVTGGEGAVDVLQRGQGDGFARIARVPTAGGARTALFVPQRNRLYVAVPHRGSQKAEVRVLSANAR